MPEGNPVNELAVEDPIVDIEPVELDQINDPPPLRRSLRGRAPVTRLQPTICGQRHHDITLDQCIAPDTHLQIMQCQVLASCLTQFSLKRGLKEFRDEGHTEIGKELNQLHERSNLSSIHC